MTVQTRAEAVAYLRGKGIDASERDWAMGQTIAAPGGLMTIAAQVGIRVWSRIIYLVPTGGSWMLHDLGSREVLGPFELQAACDAALKLLQS